MGSGIGLWVIKGIVEKMGGTIKVVSSTTVEKGTCFSISLPMKEAA
jgi:signal transduction histidine kinase